MTSRHSKQNEDNSMYSQLDFLAKIYLSPGEKKVLEKEPDQDCSTKASGYLGKFDLDSPYLKTLEIYSLTKTGKPSKKSSFKLPKQGTMRNGQLYRQEIWEPVILESESGSLPTPRANPAMSANLNLSSIKNHTSPNLETVVSNLPTPTTMDYLPQRGYESMVKQTQVHRKGRTKLANLREAVNPETVKLFNELQSLPTPTARDWKDGSQNSNKNCKKMDSLGRKIHYVLPTPTANEHKATGQNKPHQSGQMLSSIARRGELSPPTGEDMFLNPAFVEEMMGYEVGWLV